MKKKLFLLTSVLFIITILAACGDSSKDSSSNELVIGIDDKFAPMGFRDADNNIVGFDIDYARATAEEMGYDVTFQPIDWKSKEMELSSGRIDLIWNGYTITDERKEKVLFTKPYLENAQVIVVLENSDLHTIADLTDKEIGVQAQSSALDAINTHPIKTAVKSISEYGDNVLALTDLKNGRTNAIVIDSVVAEYYQTLQPNTYKILDEQLSPELYGIGVKKGNEELLEKLQSALDALKENGKAAEISIKWFGEDRVLN